MKKLICTALCTTLILLIFSCEKDDFCISNPVTPSIIFRLYEIDEDGDEELKSVDSLYIWAEGKDSIYINQSTDSITIPLNSLEDKTVYNFAQGTELLSTFTINYTREEEYVSRSCGYRIIFKDVTIENGTNTNTWITSFTPATLTTINSQESAHVKIYH